MKESRKYRRASKYLHETVVKLVKYYKPKKIIDLGSGYGGVPLKLNKLGFDITATDINPSINRASDIKCLKVDLNKEIKIKQKYDMVICTEVIEHIYNSKKLFVDAYNMLNEKGKLIVTTPNSQNWFSRLFFLFTGKFPSFQGKLYGKDRDWFEPHITPTFTWQIKMLVRKLFKIKKITFNRSVTPLIHINLPIKNLLFGQNLVMVFEKK